MQILNNLLLDTENLLQTVSSDMSENGLNTSSDASLEGGFAHYLDNQLTSFSLAENQLETDITETVFPLHLMGGQALPLSNAAPLPLSNAAPLPLSNASPLPLNENQNNNLQIDPKNLKTSLVNNIDAISGQGTSSRLENKFITEKIVLPIENNLLNKEYSNIKENLTDIRDKNNFSDLAKPIDSINLEKMNFSDIEKNLDSNLLLIKNQSTVIPENISDLSTADKSLISFNKVSHTDSISRENVLQNTKENYTLTADENFSESLSEKIDLLIKNNQKEAKISLDPAGLGKIDIQIKMANNEYVVNIFTQNEGAQQVLDQHSTKLKQLFNNEDMTFNLSQQNNSDQAKSNSQGNEARQANESINVNSHQSLKNEINNSIDRLVSSDYLTQESVSLYI